MGAGFKKYFDKLNFQFLPITSLSLSTVLDRTFFIIPVRRSGF